MQMQDTAIFLNSLKNPPTKLNLKQTQDQLKS